jgi:hypothetical protein
MPKRLKIGGFNYKIIYPYLFPNEPTYVGLHEGDQKVIKIPNMYTSYPRAWQKILESLMHEVVHAVDNCYCAKVITEDETNIFSTHLFMVLRDNDLNLKANKLSSSVKIGGFVYDIIFPYKYKDGEDCACSLNHERLQFRMTNADRLGDLYSPQNLMTNFLYLIMCAISEICSVPRGFSYGAELENQGRHFQTFVNGFYQVLVDNDLEKLMKSDGEMK